MDARGTPPQGPPGERSPWPHRAVQQGQQGQQGPPPEEPQGAHHGSPPPGPHQQGRTPQGGQPVQAQQGWQQGPPLQGSPQQGPPSGAPRPGWPPQGPPGSRPGQPPPSSPAYGAQPPPQPPPSPAYGAPTGTLPQQRPQQQPDRIPQQQPHPSAPRPPRRAADGRTTLTRVLRAWWAGRIRRLVPRGVPWTAVAFAVVLLAAWALFADILLTPGVVQEYPGESPNRAWAHDFIGWLALQITFGLGAASAAMLLLVSTPKQRWAGVGVTVVSTAITLHLVLSGPGQPLPFVAGVAASGLAAAALGVLAAMLPAPRVHMAVGSGLALAIQWGVVTWAAIVEGEQWVFLRTWIDLAFPVLLAVAFLAILAVAVYAQQVHGRADRIGRRILVASWAPIVAATVALAIVLVRMGPLATLFGDLDSNLWAYGTVWSSWPHAIVAGLVVVWLVARSSARPLRARGHVVTILVLAAMAGMPLLSFAIVHIAGIVVPQPGLVDSLFQFTLVHGNVLALACTALLLVPLLVPWFRRSTGRVGALAAIVVTVPLQVWFIMVNDLQLPYSRIAAAPSQIVLVIVVAVLVLAIWGAIRRRDVVDRHLLLRLAIVPLATAHAGQLLPGVWKEDFEQPLVVVLSVIGLLLLGAPRTGTKEGDALAIVSPFAVQVLVLGSVIVSRTMGQLTDDEITSIAVLYLTVPVAAVLCCRLEDPSDAWTQRAATVDLQMMRRGRAPGPVVAVGGWGGAPTGPQPQPQPQTPPQPQPWGGRPVPSGPPPGQPAWPPQSQPPRR